MLKSIRISLLLVFILILTYAGWAVRTNIYQDNKFTSGKFINTVGAYGNTPLQLNNGKLQGEYISKPLKTGFKFNEAIISWNCKTSANTGIAVYLRAGKSGTAWTNWYLTGQWNYTDIKNKEDKIKKDAYGRVNEDTLLLKSGYDTLQYKIILFSKNAKKSPSVRLVTICYTNTKTGSMGAYCNTPLQLDKQLSVPYRSQRIEDSSISGKICGPTSLSMLVDYYKVRAIHELPLLTADVSYACYDEYNDIYGNWPYLVAFASEQGLTGWVQYFTSIEQLKEEIKNGRPVIVGISFGERELTGSPVPSTPGHLLVVRGFDKSGNVYVNDPAFKDEKGGARTYNKDEFTRAWLKNHLGVALIFRK